MKPLEAFRDSDGVLQVQCPACGGLMRPRFHGSYREKGKVTGRCQAGCDAKWQAKIPHLRWSCGRCGWDDPRACGEVASTATIG